MQTNFEEFEKVRIPAKRMTGTIIDISVRNGHLTYYTVGNEGDADDPDAWKNGYAQFTCTAKQMAHITEPE